MSSVKYEISCNIPVVKDVDVAVVGSGPGGLGAAVAAARSGASTVVIERYGFPGGMASAGEVHPFMLNHCNEVCLDKPVYLEWTQKIQSYQPPEVLEKIDKTDEALSNFARTISKEAALLAAEDLLLDAGVEILYHHNLVDAVVEDKKISYIILASKSGYVAVKAKNFVDCSGDADLAARAGCDFELGNEEGNCQPMTTCFKLSHVKLEGNLWELREFMTQKYEEAKARGDVQCPRENILAFEYYENDIIHFNTTRVVKKSGVDGLAIAEAEIEGRRQIRQLLEFFRKEVPGFEQARLHSMAFHIGVRETRRVKGRNYLTREDFVKRSKFEDAIARCNYPIDIHSPTGAGTELVHMNGSEYYEIPYGCIVSKDIDNLTIGGRPISVDVAMHSSMRVMPPACSVGQAAGLAAAMASAQGKNPAQLDGVEVRKKLKEFGAVL